VSITTHPTSPWLEPRAGWWHPVLWGITTAALGVLLLTQPIVSAIVLVTIVAVFWLIGGIVDVIAAVVTRPAAWGWHLAAGLLSIVAALYILGHPLLGTLAAVTMLYLVISLSAIINGLIRLFAGPEAGVERVVLGGLQIALGIVLLSSFFNVLAVRALVQAIGVLAIGGGLATIVAAFRLTRHYARTPAR
jgi:uncharacterized membrane protein HdeD (DUF308 family)